MKGGLSPSEASWILIGLFIAGAVGIQVLSRILHHYIPSHVVDCDHTHDEEEAAQSHPEHGYKGTSRKAEAAEHDSLTTPNNSSPVHPDYGTHSSQAQSPVLSNHDDYESVGDLPRRPSFTSKVSHMVSLKKALCDSNGQCYGYTDPCGVGCFKIISARNGVRPPHSHPKHPHPPLSRSATAPRAGAGDSYSCQPLLLQDVEEEPTFAHDYNDDDHSYFPSSANGHRHKQPLSRRSLSPAPSQSTQHPEQHHHHHVPTNAFLSIGLQTSIAIALHKLPEGFITYATNHANPKLGFTIFLALFIHNITEGFAMALPLYLAINSRGKAMVWSALLGGVSQPMGAGVAALWFKLSGSEGDQPGEAVYGGMFAIVCMFMLSTKIGTLNANIALAGIMASVALQLFSESLDLTHNKNLCMIFAFVGMGILGVSSALTA
jgi:ZIP family zinc transporter